MHVLVVTCAHRGDDARIVHRQARSLLAEGHRVTLVAPATADMSTDPGGLVRITVPRATGRRRIPAWRAARRVVRRVSPEADLMLIHDPELIPLLARRRSGIPVVWDVHEDFVASIEDRQYIPRPLRRSIRSLVRYVEALAHRRCHVIAAEDAYTAHLGAVPVVPNTSWIPESPVPFDDSARKRLVYVGRLSRGRGLAEMIELGRRLDGRFDVVLIGDADSDVLEAVREASCKGLVTWLGALANPAAIAHVGGALAGLSLLHDEPNYRHSRPTKLLEYMAQGVPVISTPLPVASQLVRASGSGTVVPFGDLDAVVEAVDSLNVSRRDELGSAGHAYVAEHHDWGTDGVRFVRLLESWAQTARCPENADAARGQREREFHDRRFATGLRTATAKFYSVDRGKERYREVVNSVAQPGTSILEFGCGPGALALSMASRGADVTAIDISTVAIEQAEKRARSRGISVDFVEMDAEGLEFEDNSFDVVCGSAILHHLDLEAAMVELSRVLRPNGRAVFLEPLGHNPLINLYRRLTPALRTQDEHPLTTADIELARRHFARVDTECFDLIALAGVPVRDCRWGAALQSRLHRLDSIAFARSGLARRWAWMTLVSLGEPIER